MVLNRRFASSAESDLTTPRTETCIIPGVNGRPEKESTTDVLQKQLDLPFDQYQKYRMVADVVERLREDAGPLRILDAGGEQDILRDFLPEDRVTVLDPRAAEEGAAAFPYEEQAFDYAVSLDVFGRIEPGARDEHLLELRRVSQRGVLLAAPFDSDVVRGAERVAHEFRRALHRADDVGSLQYAGNGLPKLEEAQRFFEEREDTVFVLPNGYVPHWLAMTCLASYGSKLDGDLDGDLDGILEHLNAFYYESIFKLDNAEPSYRHVLVSLKEPAQADLSDMASSVRYPEQRAPTSAALFGTLSAMLPLTTEVRQLNARLAQRERQLAQKEGALARRELQIDDLSRRLAEHIYTKNTLVQTEERVRQLLQSVQDLSRSQNTLERKNAALARREANLERRKDELEHRKDELQQQLARTTNSRGWRLLTAVSRLRSRISRSG
jgi:O-antigen biosynthesis protein